ncbi:MAG TPA: pseudouridine synthase [Vicinamibacterales bacterium]|nr:pseudouridine synthase [Vicinamibacterales bacterium]
MKKMPQNRPWPRRKAGLVPLGRALSKLGVLSRAQAITAVLDGRVRVNGQVERNPAALVAPERTRLLVDGKPAVAAAWRTVLFHKPRGVVTTRIDPEGRRTIYDVLGEPGQGLIAVGRLDMATSGLLLLTTDTRLADWITDPAHAVPRLYAVTVRGRIVETDIASLTGRVTVRKTSARESHLLVELTEGKNRQVRQMFESIGHEVTALKRVKLGGLDLGGLEPGQHRELTLQETVHAFPGAPLRAVQ